MRMVYIDLNIAKSLPVGLRFTLRVCLHCRSSVSSNQARWQGVFGNSFVGANYCD